MTFGMGSSATAIADDENSRRISVHARLMVCIGEQSDSSDLVRQAHRLADRLGIGWGALYIESGRHAVLGEARRDRIADALRLAELLGGDATTLPGERIAEAILDFARESGVTLIVVGKSRRARWSGLLHRSVVRDLVRNAGDISIHVAGGGDAAASRRRDPASAGAALRRMARRLRPLSYLAAVGFIAIGTLFGIPLYPVVGGVGIALMYLTEVLITAVGFGLGPSLLASVLCVLGYDYFFTNPLYSLAISNPHDIAAIILFVIVALITSNLAARTRAQVMIARNRAKTTAELFAFSRQLAGVTEIDELLSSIVAQLAAILQSRIAIFLTALDAIVLRAVAPLDTRIGAAELAEARIAAQGGGPGGAPAGPTGHRWDFVPLRTAKGTLGVIGIGREVDGRRPTTDDRRLLEALADQASIAIERIIFAAEIDQARLLQESERLRSALLTSISHDLRTPLASVLGALTSLRSFDDRYDPQTRRDLLDTAQEEAERLNRFVGNLLDMTKLEAGAIEIRRDPLDLADIIGSAVRHARTVIEPRHVAIDMPPDLPMPALDFVLFEQALFNLLDNAAKYTPPSSTISVAVRHVADRVTIEIADEGPGIPPADLERIFDKFYRVRSSDHQRAGTGLGLVVSRGFIEAQGGRIVAGNRNDCSGAVFTITLPCEPMLPQAIDHHGADT
jgi:two-component system sensor histidine kinase KdpD